ncbi:ribosomal protein L28e [Epithele typhae]|uniref:ribosomal protein L28e n=1 Tax=Epithele typhae TaxID=378194 RepID=UPI002008C96C|nr:ribosomal protein L28e [Epithele typhae]KAH9934080.1 ribosomal protein L28e [Epithele typhae]
MSSDLQWLLLRNNNAYIVKSLPGGPILSREPGNLVKVHSQKYCSFANEKAILIKDTEAGIELITRKKGAAPTAVASGYAKTVIRPRSGGRRAAGITAKLAKRGYRPDLRTAALAHVSAIIASKKEKKAAPPKKARGKKAKTA